MKMRELGLSSELVDALDLLEYKTPSPIQELVIPWVLKKQDIQVKAQTGSGKTAAFGIPLCEMIQWMENKPQALVIVPTRELAIQVAKEIGNIGRFKRMKVSCIYGRAPINRQENELKQKTHIVVGTPGRILDLISRGILDVSKLQYVVIDEADEMFFIGLREQVERILLQVPKERVTMLFSATMNEEAKKLSEQYMKNPIELKLKHQAITVENIQQSVLLVEEMKKVETVEYVAMRYNPDCCILFVNTQKEGEYVAYQLRKKGFTVECLHGGLEQRERNRIMSQFKEGRFRYLVATDVAARGIDIERVSLVINYDLPREQEKYVHRIGRSGRKNETGRAVTFVTSKELDKWEKIEEYIQQTVQKEALDWTQISSSMKEAFEEKLKKEPERKKPKEAVFHESIMTLSVNAGKKAKIRPVDIVGTLCSIEGVTPEDIGVIRIQDTTTTVEILHKKGAMVLRKLQTKTIKGKQRKVRKAR